MQSKLLVTGGGGYIGSIMCQELLQLGHKIIVIDDFSKGYKSPLKYLQKKFPQRLEFHTVDITNQNALASFFSSSGKIEAVFHFAGVCVVDESMNNPDKYFRINSMGTLNLLECMQRAGIKNLVFSSTCAVYGDITHPVTEKDPTQPTNPYGTSKLLAEEMIHWHGRLFGLRYAILRYFNVCGATQDGALGESKKPSTYLVQNAVKGALGISNFNLTCPKVETPDKTPIRDYIHVLDLCQAHILALQTLKKQSKVVLNLGTESGSSVLEIVQSVEKITGKKLKKSTKDVRQGEYPISIADASQAKKLLGWQATRSLEEAVTDLIRWYTLHPDGWKS